MFSCRGGEIVRIRKNGPDMKGETEASFRCLLTFDADGSLPLFTGAVEGIVVPVVIEKKREAAEKKSQNPQLTRNRVGNLTPGHKHPLPNRSLLQMLIIIRI